MYNHLDLQILSDVTNAKVRPVGGIPIYFPCAILHFIRKGLKSTVYKYIIMLHLNCILCGKGFTYQQILLACDFLSGFLFPSILMMLWQCIINHNRRKSLCTEADRADRSISVQFAKWSGVVSPKITWNYL